MIVLDLSILNQKGTPMFYSDIFANRPSFGIVGRIFISTDTAEIFRDTGSSWDLIADGGGGVDTNIYNTNGTLTGNRTVASGGYYLLFNPQTTFNTTLTASVSESIYSVIGVNNLSYTAGFSSNNIGNVYVGNGGYNLQTFAGSATFAQANVASGIVSINSIDFSSASSTITMTQSSGIRAMTGSQSMIQYQGTNSGTITHAAVHQNLGLYRPSAATGTLTISNAYSLLLNALDDYGSGFTFTNRWGIYQAGTNDKNYFAANILAGSLIDTGEKLQITGTAKVTSTLTANSFVKSAGTSSQILAADGSVITAGTNINISGGTISSTGGGGGSMAIGGAITSATAGSVLFAGTSGVLAQNNANFFWDNTNSRLGIGTTIPTEKIHVLGNILISNGTQNATISNRKGASSGGFNIWIGNGGVNTSGSGANGSYNVSLGYDSLLNATTAQSNIAIGYNSLKNNSTGNQNIAIGGNSLQTATGGLNTSIGFQSLSSLTTGFSNTALGLNTAFFLTTGNENTAIGYESLVNATTSTGNTAVGYRSVYGSGANYNSGLGYYSLQSVTAEHNTALGAFSLRYSTSGIQNVAIGYLAGVGTALLYNTTGSNNIFIGTNSVGVSSTESNRTFIGNDSTITSWIGGNLILGSKTTTGEKLQITGTIRINGQTAITAGGSAGLHLIINLDGTNYKIALLNV